MLTRIAAFALLLALPARAADCDYTADRAHVLCTTEGYTLLVDELDQVRHDRDVALAANRALEVELRVRLEQVPAPSPWGYVLAGGAGFVLAVAVVVLVR